jgi:hypothetical protein
MCESPSMRPAYIIGAVLAVPLACASTTSPTSDPETANRRVGARDPCDRAESPGLAEVMFGTASADAACAEQRRQEAEAEEVRRLQLSARADVEARANYEAQRQVREQEEKKAEEEKAAALARANQIHERSQFEAAVVAAGETGECLLTWDETLAAYEVLREYAADSRRDKAIGRLERCRKEYAARVYKNGPSVFAEQRKTVAILLEDAFDEANPYRKGLLVAKVDGSQLMVRLKGNIEGRARHSEEEVETWCEMSATRVFSKVTLKNTHGTFSCRPLGWPGSTKGLLNELLVETGGDRPLEVTPGTRPVPNSPEVVVDPMKP